MRWGVYMYEDKEGTGHEGVCVMKGRVCRIRVNECVCVKRG